MASSEHTGLYISPFQRDGSSNGHGWRQPGITARAFLDDLRVGDGLESGGNGSVYHCHFRGQAYALKIPVGWVKQKHLQISEEGRLLCDPTLRATHLHQGAVDRFDIEFSVAERVLDPPTLRLHYANRVRAGWPAHDMSDSNYHRMQGEMAFLERHPGHQHLLRLIHFQPEIPCILMERCDGDALDLMRNGHFDRNPHARYAFVQQVLLAMEYLLHYAQLAQIDHKLENILYCGHPSGGARLLYKLGDYGLCTYAQRGGKQGGTPKFYVPHALAAQVDAFTLSCLQLAMMVYLLLVDDAHRRPLYNTSALVWGAIQSSCLRDRNKLLPADDPLSPIIHDILTHPTEVRRWYPQLCDTAGVPMVNLPFNLANEPPSLKALEHTGRVPPPIDARQGEIRSSPPRQGEIRPSPPDPRQDRVPIRPSSVPDPRQDYAPIRPRGSSSSSCSIS